MQRRHPRRDAHPDRGTRGLTTVYTADVRAARDRHRRHRGQHARGRPHLDVHHGAPPVPCTIWSRRRRRRPSSAARHVRGRARREVPRRRGGNVTGIRFYKGTGNTGTHVGTCGRRRARCWRTATFTGETDDRLAAGDASRRPVAVTADTTYVASYHAPNGHYAVDRRHFTAGVDNGAAARAGRRRVGRQRRLPLRPARAFPNSSYNATNYWVDVLFQPS